jgi:hypothetical protein
MHSLINISKHFFLRNYLSKQLIRTNRLFFCDFNRRFNNQNPQENLDNKEKTSEINNNNNNSNQNLTNQFTENKPENNNDTKVSDINTDIPKGPKTRKEEVMFYIMHDKYSVRPDKEYRIRHTTVESTDIKTKMKDLNVLYYGKN